MEGEERLGCGESLVGDEGEKDDTSEYEKDDDLVVVPIESTLVDEIEREEKARPSSTEEEKSESIKVDEMSPERSTEVGEFRSEFTRVSHEVLDVLSALTE